jgi:polar amino acid transport system substrate-binding protein
MYATLFGFVLTIPVSGQPVHFRFCYQDTELFPNYIGRSSAKPTENPGVHIELLELITSEAGASVSYMRYSWNRCLALLKAGKVDSLIASYNTSRAAIAAYPFKDGALNTDQRITTSGYYLYHQGTTPLWDGKNFLKPNIVIAAPLGYSIAADLKAKNLKVMEASTTEQLLSLLYINRIDAVAAPGSTADAIIRREANRYSGIVKDIPPLKQSPYFIIFSHGFYAHNKKLVETIWKTSETIRQSHRQALVEKY